ncbi:hypothetical protein E2C01_039305 [Portunus trituberculatus]|uniref:Uncharacterized protein n=1 Tax=Portunus trituberculatus TaxID=210409 RepID=A0A5B7FEE8_PORTR|nr:hypothetical protein [Portunus trituberculatus]
MEATAAGTAGGRMVTATPSPPAAGVPGAGGDPDHHHHHLVHQAHPGLHKGNKVSQQMLRCGLVLTVYWLAVGSNCQEAAGVT